MWSLTLENGSECQWQIPNNVHFEKYTRMDRGSIVLVKNVRGCS